MKLGGLGCLQSARWICWRL